MAADVAGRSCRSRRGATRGAASSSFAFGRLKPGVTLEQAQSNLQARSSPTSSRRSPSTTRAAARPRCRCSRRASTRTARAATRSRSCRSVLMVVVGIVLLIALRQHRQPAARARVEAPPRGRDPAGARRAAASRLVRAAADREPAALARSAAPPACCSPTGRSTPSSRPSCRCPSPPTTRWPSTRACWRSRIGAVAADRDPVRPRARAAGLEGRRGPGAARTSWCRPPPARAAVTGLLSLRQALVVAQVALSVISLVAGGLFLRDLQHAQAIDPGLRDERRADGELQSACARAIRPSAAPVVPRPRHRARCAPPRRAEMRRSRRTRRSPAACSAACSWKAPRPTTKDRVLVAGQRRSAPATSRRWGFRSSRGRDFTAADTAATPDGRRRQRDDGAAVLEGRGPDRQAVQVLRRQGLHDRRRRRAQQQVQRRRARSRCRFIYEALKQDYTPAGALHVRAAGDAAALRRRRAPGGPRHRSDARRCSTCARSRSRSTARCASSG